MFFTGRKFATQPTRTRGFRRVGKHESAELRGIDAVLQHHDSFGAMSFICDQCLSAGFGVGECRVHEWPDESAERTVSPRHPVTEVVPHANDFLDSRELRDRRAEIRRVKEVDLEHIGPVLPEERAQPERRLSPP